jgi:hypothetical protein
LLLLARFDLTGAQRQAVRELLQDRDQPLSWGFFLDQACRHRVLPLAVHNLLRYGLHRHSGDGRMLVSYWWLFDAALSGNRRRNQLLGAEYGRVIRGLVEAGVPHAVRKGPAIAGQLYPDPALRMTRDLDILVTRDDFPELDACLTALGYTQGRAGAGDRIEPFTRRTRVYWEMFLANRLPYVRASGHSGIDWYVIDPAVSIFPTSIVAETDTPAVLARTRQVRLHGERGHVLDWTDWLLDLSMHLYEKAVSRHFIRRRKDACVGQYLDLAALCLAAPSTGSWQQFHQRVDRYRVGAQAFHALYHTRSLYPEAVPAAVLDALRPADTDYLDTYGELDGAPGRWSEPFLTRLFNPRRADEVPGESPVPTV